MLETKVLISGRIGIDELHGQTSSLARIGPIGLGDDDGMRPDPEGRPGPTPMSVVTQVVMLRLLDHFGAKDLLHLVLRIQVLVFDGEQLSHFGHSRLDLVALSFAGRGQSGFAQDLIDFFHAAVDFIFKLEYHNKSNQILL